MPGCNTSSVPTDEAACSCVAPCGAEAVTCAGCCSSLASLFDLASSPALFSADALVLAASDFSDDALDAAAVCGCCLSETRGFSAACLAAACFISNWVGIFNTLPANIWSAFLLMNTLGLAFTNACIACSTVIP